MMVRVCFHDKCFDGAASAAVFTRFYCECINPQAEFAYTGLTHRAAQVLDAALFDGDENAIVDFKYSPSPRLTWWFDHHQSAFLTSEDAEHFHRDQSGRKFFNPEFKSCTKFLASVAESKFHFQAAPLADLIEWADIIDGAQYPTPESAVKMDHPATQLALVIEAAPDHDLTKRLIPDLAQRSLAEIVKLPYVAEHFAPLFERHQASIATIQKNSEYRDRVVYLDVSDHHLEAYNKFIPYFLYPGCYYSVGVSLSPERAKVAVGSNPWSRPAVEKNLASICERYGGGGHPRVAAISFEPHDIQRARQAAREIAEELRR